MTVSSADLSRMSDRQLLALSASCVSELRTRGVVRTGNAPLGDYVEWLAALALGGELAPNSERSFDFTSGDGRRVQVKSRRISDPLKPGQLQTSPFRSWGFDQALLVLVDDATFEIRRASLVPLNVVRDLSRYVPHVNGSHVYMTEELMAHAHAIDVTDQLRTAASDGAAAPPPPPPPSPPPPPTPPPPPPSQRFPPQTTGGPQADDIDDASGRIKEASDLDWIWLAHGAIDEFQMWRIQGGASAASAASYASGARAFVQYCRSQNLEPQERLVEGFPGHLARTRGISPRAISDYCAHARAFIKFHSSFHRLQG